MLALAAYPLGGLGCLPMPLPPWRPWEPPGCFLVRPGTSWVPLVAPRLPDSPWALLAYVLWVRLGSSNPLLVFMPIWGSPLSLSQCAVECFLYRTRSWFTVLGRTKISLDIRTAEVRLQSCGPAMHAQVGPHAQVTLHLIVPPEACPLLHE